MTARTQARRLSRAKKLLVLGTGATVLIGGGAAFAYWTSTGSGTGSGTSSTPPTVTVVQTSTISGVNPGVAAQTLSGNFTNPGPGNAYVTSVTVSFTVTKAAGAASGTCDTTDYTLTTPTMSVGQDVATGSAQGSWTGAKIQFNNKTTNQDQCKGATLNFAYTAA